MVFFIAICHGKGYYIVVYEKININNLTNDLSQVETITLAVYLLGGDRRAVDTEDVAMKVHELAPGRFAWRKYPAQINLELVRVYLSDAKKANKGGLVSGSGRTGWSLTSEGLKWARAAGHRAEGVAFERRREESRAGSIEENRWRRERSRILSTVAWSRWAQGERDLSVKEASELFRIDSYAGGQLRDIKITRLTSLFADDEQIGPFLDYVGRLLRGPGA